MNPISFHAEKGCNLAWIPLITTFNCKASLIWLTAAHVLLLALHLYSIYVWRHIPGKIVSGDTYITKFSAYASLLCFQMVFFETRVGRNVRTLV